MTEKYLTESEVRKLLQCSRCKKSPLNAAPIYLCRTGHSECSDCYNKFSEIPRLDKADASTDSESDSYNGSHTCSICNEEVLTTRNLLAETLITQLETTKNEKHIYQGVRSASDQNCVECCYNIYNPQCQPGLAVTPYDPQPYGRCQDPCSVQQYSYNVTPYLDNSAQLEYGDGSVPYTDFDNVSYYNGCRSAILERRTIKYSFVPPTSVISLAGEPSKRPIRCPTHLCGRNIAVTALTSHFCFDHPDVPPVNVDFDVSSHLFIAPDVIPFNYGRCVAMLLIPNKFDSVNSASQANLLTAPKWKNSLPLVVMASRLECVTNPENEATPLDETTRTESLNQGDFVPKEHGKTPLLVIWIAGIETNSSLFTTLQVTEQQTNIRSVVYTGPITSLRSCQNTTKVLEQGDCLVIHSGILENIIGDKGGFDLHVVIH